MSNTLKNYNKLNKRNNKKDITHLNKHAMHLVRLLLTGTDILNGKGIITNRKDEKKMLLDIRNGLYSYEEIFEIRDELIIYFEEAKKNTKLKDDVDYSLIQKVLIDTYKN